MSLPTPQESPITVKASYTPGEFMCAVINLLLFILRGDAPGGSTSINPSSSGSNVFAQPVKTTAVATGVLANGDVATIGASNLHLYITNASADNVLYVKYGTGAGVGDYTRIVQPGGEIQVNDWQGVVSVFGTTPTGRFALLG